MPVQNIDGFLVADQNECAATCEADLACNAASYYLDPSLYGDRNCFTKILSIPCELPPDAASDEGAVLLLKDTECMPPHMCGMVAFAFRLTTLCSRAHCRRRACSCQRAFSRCRVIKSMQLSG